MVQRLDWFQRKFTFDLEAWMFPNIVERLRGTPARAEELLFGMDKAMLTKRLNGKWSMLENLGHLLDLEPLWLGRGGRYPAGEERNASGMIVTPPRKNALFVSSAHTLLVISIKQRQQN